MTIDFDELAEGRSVVVVEEEPDLEEPVFIEGLPGIGHVGKLAAEALIEDLNAVKFAELYSPYFPPHVSVNESGLIKIMKNEFYYYEGEGDEPDLIFVTGEAQAQGELGQHEVTVRILKLVKSLGAKRIITLGGLGTGTVPTEPKVVGVATHPHLIDLLKEHNVEIRKGDGGGNIVGASGLLLGFGKLMGLEGICLMGVTPGHVVDPRAAMAVVEKLTSILGVEVEADSLKKRAERFEREFVTQVEELMTSVDEMTAGAEEKTDEDLRYIG
ncbi:MAG: proteasome assembly chaperone family protein [Methanopyri archaeon]|nr:proteasome assembly chaperone family protein [Methanopyri archaeon]